MTLVDVFGIIPLYDIFKDLYGQYLAKKMDNYRRLLQREIGASLPPNGKYTLFQILFSGFFLNQQNKIRQEGYRKLHKEIQKKVSYDLGSFKMEKSHAEVQKDEKSTIEQLLLDYDTYFQEILDLSKNHDFTMLNSNIEIHQAAFTEEYNKVIGILHKITRGDEDEEIFFKLMGLDSTNIPKISIIEEKHSGFGFPRRNI